MRSATKKKLEERSAQNLPPKKSLFSEEKTSEFMNLGTVYFDSSKNDFWILHPQTGWVNYNETQFRRYLKTKGYYSKQDEGKTYSEIDWLMVKVSHERRLDFCGQVGGYPPGLHRICGKQVLITHGPKIPEAARGKWDTLKNFFTQLLGTQTKYFFSWLKSAFVSLESGFPWRPGQLLAIAGPANCGKSLCQSLITEILGGRACKPYQYLIGESNFNSHFLSTEHWMIEDDTSSTDFRARRHLGAMLKNAIVNSVQNYHAKGRDPLSVTPFVRLTFTLNDNEDSLLVLPPLERDIIDKVILLRASKADTPGEKNGENARRKFWETLLGEIPAFIFALKNWEIPKEIRDKRFGVVAWQNPDLVKDVQTLSNEFKLLNLLDLYDPWGPTCDVFEGDALDVERFLRHKDKSGEVAKLLYYTSSCGRLLSALAKATPQRVTVISKNGHQNLYAISKPKKFKNNLVNSKTFF